MDEKSAAARQDVDGANETPLSLVLGGGGAKGIAHIAAWAALEPLISTPTRKVKDFPPELGERRFQLTEVAGTSAGALMAAFIAAGATSTDLVDAKGRVPLCGALGLNHFHEISGEHGWRRLKLLRNLYAPSPSRRTVIQRELDQFARKRRPDRREFYWKMDVAHQFIGLVSSLLFAVLTIFLTVILIDAARKPLETGIFVLSFLLGVSIFRTISKTLRAWLEVKGRLRFSRTYRAVFGPFGFVFASCTFAVLCSPIIVASFSTIPGEFELWGQSKINSTPLREAVFSLFCALLVAMYVFGGLRRFLKGAISSAVIVRDLDRALRAILAMRPALDHENGHYVWKPRARDSLDQKKQNFLLADPYPLLTFGEIYEATGIKLSVVAADVVGLEACVYSTMTHSNFPVAKAVAASLAIPIAFRPIIDGPRVLFDGGLVSNLPIWVQQRQQMRDPDARILTIGLESYDRDPWLPQFLALRTKFLRAWSRRGGRGFGALIFLCRTPISSLLWPLKLISNALTMASAGQKSLDFQANNRLDNISLSPEFGVLDFDISSEQLRQEITTLGQIARLAITNILWARERAFHEACKVIEYTLRSGEQRGRVRMFWAEPDQPGQIVRTRFCYGFAPEDLDDRLVYPYGASVTGLAAQTRRCLFASASIDRQLFGGVLNRYRSAVRWPDLQWTWAIPVLDSGSSGALHGVLTLQSDHVLGALSPELDRAANERLQEWIDPATDKIKRSEGGVPIAPPVRVAGDTMTLLEENFAALVKLNFLAVQPPRSRFPVGE
jgi:predicted acylesterase/phospholipase RssA